MYEENSTKGSLKQHHEVINREELKYLGRFYDFIKNILIIEIYDHNFVKIFSNNVINLKDIIIEILKKSGSQSILVGK